MKKLISRVSDRHRVRGHDLNARRPLPAEWRTVVRKRLSVVVAVVIVWAAVIEARLIHIQTAERERLVQRAEAQKQLVTEVPAERGDIVDRHGRLLAYSVDGDVIAVDPTSVSDPAGTVAAVCEALGDCSAAERERLLERVSRRDVEFAYIRRVASPGEAARVRALDLEGIHFFKESRRYYPNRDLAAHVLGYVGVDNVGLAGVESTYDDQIRGHAGRRLLLKDARRRTFGRLERPPTAGATLELTLDERLQYATERALQSAVEANDATGGVAIVMDPESGEILAMANAPSFNPNLFSDAPPRARRNRAVQDLYEPGSTFKIVTMSAVLEEGVGTLETPLDVSAGQIRFGSRVIRDVRPYGVLSFRDVVVKSSNVGVIKMGLQLGQERMVRYVRRFGFGEPIGVNFPGESGGIVWEPSALTEGGLASVSMGYQIGVTALQMAAAASAVANGGELVTPRVVRAFIGADERVETVRHVVRRSIQPETAAKLTGVMEEVVERGTGRAAQIDGYTLAGKSGTAAKIVDGRYSKSEYNASFVGFVPSRDPVATIVVVIDSPHAGSYYGGAVAAPVFREIAREVIREFAVPRTIEPEPPVIVAPGRPAPVTGPRTLRTASRGEGLPTTSIPRGVMPDLSGLSARDAVRVLAELGVTATLMGDGVVSRQGIPAGAPVTRGTRCDLTLSRSLDGP